MWASLKDVFTNPEKSALRILLSIFFWFIAYNAVEAFFTLYAYNHLKMTESDGSRSIGADVSVVCYLCAACWVHWWENWQKKYNPDRIELDDPADRGRCISFHPRYLPFVLTKLPVLGVVPVVGVILMIAGIAWACVNINSLPMVVDLTTHAKLGIFTSLYYLFSTLAAIAGPNINGWIVQLTGKNYAMVMVIAPIFFLLALISMAGVKRGEASTSEYQSSTAHWWDTI